MNPPRRNLKVIAASALAALSLSACSGYASPGTLTGDYLSGRFAARANALDDAAQAYAAALEGAPQESELLREAVVLYSAAGDIATAARYAGILLEGSDAPSEGLAELVLVAEALSSGRYHEARLHLANATAAPLAASIAYILDAWIEYGIAGPAAAIARLDAAPASAFAAFHPLHRALLADMAGRVDEARAGYQIALLSLGGPVGRAAYGAFLERESDIDTATEYYTLIANERGPLRRVALAGLARVGSGAQTHQYARVTPSQGAAIAYYSFAGALIEQAAGQRARAEEAGFTVGDPRFNVPLALAQIALRLDPDLADARLLVGAILNVYGDHRKALTTLEAIPPISPHFEQARIDMAGALLAQGENAAAVALLQRAIAQDREGQELRFTLASVYSRERRYIAAIALLDEIIAARQGEEEGDWRHYIARAAALLELDRWDKAEVDLLKAVELAPEEPTTLNYLGYSWAERGVNLQEAFDLIKKAVDLQPNSGAIVDSLGWAYYQLGDYSEAVGHLERAASLEPSDPTITDHLGDVYWRLGRQIEARYQWRRALELEPTDRQRDSIEEKLKAGLSREEKPEAPE